MNAIQPMDSVFFAHKDQVRLSFPIFVFSPFFSSSLPSPCNDVHSHPLTPIHSRSHPPLLPPFVSQLHAGVSVGGHLILHKTSSEGPVWLSTHRELLELTARDCDVHVKPTFTGPANMFSPSS